MARPRKNVPKRRSDHEGSVIPTSTGKWRLQVTIGTKPNGQLNRIDRLFDSEEAAQAKRAELIAAYAEHNASGVVPTVAGVVQAWYRDESPAWEVSRQAIVQGEIDLHLINDLTIAHIPADRLTVPKVKDWMQSLADDDMTWATIRTYRQHLSTALNWAMVQPDTRVRANPVKLINPKWKPQNLKPPREITWLTLEEATRLIEYCQQPHEAWGPFFLTCAMVGMRPGEAFALRPRAVDFERGTVWIGAAVKRSGDCAVAIGATKNSRTGEEKSRTVALDRVVLEALRRQMDNVELARSVYAEEWSQQWGDLIFVTTKNDRAARPGEIVSQSNVRTNLDRVCAAAGVRRITPYELRHSCASILLHKKVPPAVVAEMLGTSERMLRVHYRHLIDPVIREGAAVWSEILRP